MKYSLQLILLLSAFFFSSCGNLFDSDQPSTEEKLRELNVFAITNKATYTPEYDRSIRVTIKNASPFKVYLKNPDFIKVQTFINEEWQDGSPTNENGYWFDPVQRADLFVLKPGEELVTDFLSVSKDLNNERGTYRFKLDFCLSPYTKDSKCEIEIPGSQLTNNPFNVGRTIEDYGSIDARFRSLDLEFITDRTTYVIDSQSTIPLGIQNNSPFPIYLNPYEPFVKYEAFKNNQWVSGLDGNQNGGWSFRLERPEYYVLDMGERVSVRPLNIDDHLFNTPGRYRFNFSLCLEEWNNMLCEANVPDDLSSLPFSLVQTN